MLFQFKNNVTHQNISWKTFSFTKKVQTKSSSHQNKNTLNCEFTQKDRVSAHATKQYNDPFKFDYILRYYY